MSELQTRCRRLVAGAAALLITVTLGPTVDAAAAPRRPLELLVDLTTPGDPITAAQSGANHRFASPVGGCAAGSAPWTSPTAADAGFVAAIRRTGAAPSRFPGGTVANLYHWRDAMGAQPRPPTPHLNGSLPNTFGPTEWADLLRATDTPASSVVVNFATGTPAEAAEFAAWSAAATGVRRFEVGNEFGFGAQAYWLEAVPEAERAAAYVDGRAVRFSDQPAAEPGDYCPRTASTDGSPDQVRTVRYPPIETGSTTVVRVDGSTWTRVSTLAEAGARDVYTLDEVTGRITFGDGVDGNAPRGEVTVDYTRARQGFVDYARAIGAAVPGAEVCTGFNTFERDRHTALIETLADRGVVPDCVAHHTYTASRTQGTVIELHDWMMARGSQKFAELAELQAEHREVFGRDVDLAISEYGTLPGEAETDAGRAYRGGLGGALYTAEQWRGAIAAGEPVSSKHTLAGQQSELNSLLFPGDGGWVRTPSGMVFEVLTPFIGSRLLTTRLESPTRVSQLANGGLAYDVLTTLAARDETTGTVRVLIVNRDPYRAHPIRLGVTGARGITAEVVAARTAATAEQALMTLNDSEHPEAVDITGTPVTGRVYAAPPASVTVLTFAS